MRVFATSKTSRSSCSASPPRIPPTSLMLPSTVSKRVSTGLRRSTSAMEVANLSRPPSVFNSDAINCNCALVRGVSMLASVCSAYEHVVEVGVVDPQPVLAENGGVRSIDITEFLNFSLAKPSATGIRLVDQTVDVSSQSLFHRVLGLKKLFGCTAHGAADVRAMQAVDLGDPLEAAGFDV